MSDESPPEPWAWMFMIHTGMENDPPAFEALKKWMRAQGEASAAMNNVVLDGDPVETIRDLVWVRDWSDDGDGLIERDIAVAMGYTPDEMETGGREVRWEWTTR